MRIIRFFILLISASLFLHSAQAVTLDEAVQAALEKNETIGRGREQVVQAEEQVTQAKSAVYPNLSFEATHLVQPEPSDPLARDFFPPQQTTTNLTLSQPLFRGFREFAAVRQRNNLLTAQKQDRQTTVIQLYEQVASSYLSVLAMEQDLKNLLEQRKLYSERVKELQARIRRGESSSTESLTAQSTAAALESEIQISQAQLRTARENFSFLTSLPPDTPLKDGDGQKIEAGLRPLDEYIARIEERPDIKSAKERLSASEESVSIAKGGHWPSADLIGHYYFTRPEGFLSDQKWDVQVTLTLPLFEGGLRQSQVREAASKRKETELFLNQLRRQTTAEIRSLYESLKMRADQLKALKEASEISERNYQVLQRDYRRGLSRNIDVQQAMTDYRVTRRTYDQARFAARLDLIRLETAAVILPQALTKEM